MRTYSRSSFGNDSEDWRIIIISLICILILLIGVIGVIIITNNEKMLILEETPLRQFESNVASQTIENAGALDAFFSRIGGFTIAVGEYTTKLWNTDILYNRTSYYHNATIEHPIGYSYSSKHQQNVSYYYSGYKVAASSYNNESDYLNLPDSQTFGDWNLLSNRTVELSSNLDFMFQSTYQAMSEILWVYVGFSEGVHRSYPYHGPYSKNYDPRVRPWYLAALDAPENEVIFTTPYIDASTNSIIVTCSYPIKNATNYLIGVVGIDFKLTTLQKAVLDIDVPNNGHAFLINQDNHIITHPDHVLPNATWDTMDLQVSITDLETNSIDFVTLLDTSHQNFSQSIIDYDTNGLKLVSLVPLNSTGLILGLVADYNYISISVIPENIWFVILIIAFFIIGSSLIISIFKFRQLSGEM